MESFSEMRKRHSTELRILADWYAKQIKDRMMVDEQFCYEAMKTHAEVMDDWYLNADRLIYSGITQEDIANNPLLQEVAEQIRSESREAGYY